MADHRCCFPGLEPSFEAAESACWPVLMAVWVHGTWTGAGGVRLVRPPPGDLLASPGRDPSPKIRIAVPAVPFASWRAS
ncbi:MAG TPA: hypothetical protein VFQ44_17215 [Streptosporangiaceae bacterium]|nr:hypothetical protein [Streptosporangiaceae bacterium]